MTLFILDMVAMVSKFRIVLLLIFLLFILGELNPMARGHPDWGQSQETIIVHSVSDLGELAARLGSPNTYQRSGNVIFQTDFEHGLADLIQSTKGANASISLVGDRSFSKGVSVKLVGGSDGNRRSILTKRLHSVESTTAGIEAAFSLDENCEYFALAIELFDGSDRYLFQVFANILEEELQYYASDEEKVLLTSDVWGGGDLDTWHIIKMTVDLENKNYLRVFSNAEEYSLSGSDPWTGVDARDPRLDLYAWVLSKDGENGIVYLDNLILTINEP